MDSARAEIITNLQKKALADYMQGMRDASTIVFNKDLEAAQPADMPEAAAEEAAPEEAASDTAEEAPEETTAPASE